MLSTTEIARGIDGAVRLMKGDLSGLVLLDRSREGFWRSFRPALLLAPLYGLYLMIAYDDVATRSSDARIVLVETLRYILDWTLFPVVLLELCRKMGRTRRYIASVVALNWTNVLFLVTSVGVMMLARLFAPGLIDTISLATIVIMVVLTTPILRHTLDLPWIPAVALASLNIWLSLMLGFIANGIIGIMPAGA
jgi:hypothetical protein